MSRDWRSIELRIPGDPRGKGRPRFYRKGNVVGTHPDEKTAAYENLIKLAFDQAYPGWEATDHPVAVRVYAYYTPPGSWSKKKQREAENGHIFKTTKPDTDNIMKAVLDALNKVAWKDDAQVVDESCCKRYFKRSELYIRIDNLDWDVIPALDFKPIEKDEDSEVITEADLEQAYRDGERHILEIYMPELLKEKANGKS